MIEHKCFYCRSTEALNGVYGGPYLCDHCKLWSAELKTPAHEVEVDSDTEALVSYG